jgi:AcrR family transcriptional regulator
MTVSVSNPTASPPPGQRPRLRPSPRPAGRGSGARWSAAATRQALLVAAAALFSERGFDGVPIEDVAARAGVNKALISYHFGGKRGLYAAVLESGFAEMAERLRAVEAEARDARQALRGLLEAFQRVAREHPGFPTLFLREVLASGVEPRVVPYLVEIVGVSRRLAARGVREGLFRRVDPLLLHFGLVGSLVFFFATEPARHRAASRGEIPFAMPDAKAFVRYLEELTLRGLARERRSASPRRKGAHA